MSEEAKNKSLINLSIPEQAAVMKSVSERMLWLVENIDERILETDDPDFDHLVNNLRFLVNYFIDLFNHFKEQNNHETD